MQTLDGERYSIQESTVTTSSYIIQLKIMPFKHFLPEDKNRWWTTALAMTTSVLTEGEDMMEIQMLNRIVQKLEKKNGKN